VEKSGKRKKKLRCCKCVRKVIDSVDLLVMMSELLIGSIDDLVYDYERKRNNILELWLYFLFYFSNLQSCCVAES